MPNDTNESNIIRLGNLDQPLYRVYALDRFEQLLATKDDALLNPTKWEDPFENFFLEATEVMDPQSGGKISQKISLLIGMVSAGQPCRKAMLCGVSIAPIPTKLEQTPKN